MYTVLIVDDEKYIRKSIINRIHWEACGCEVIGEAGDGMEACDRIAQLQPQIVITDIRMPGMDGLSLAARIAEDYPRIRVIIISAYNDFDYAKSAIRYGVREYILKPVEEKELEGTLLRLAADLKTEEEERLPEIYPEQMQERSFAGEMFWMVSFYTAENRDKAGRRELSFRIYRRMLEKENETGAGTEIFLYHGEREEIISFLCSGKEFSQRRIAEAAGAAVADERKAGKLFWAGISESVRTAQPDENLLFRMESQSLMAMKWKILYADRWLFFCSEHHMEGKMDQGKYQNELFLLYDLSMKRDWTRLRMQIRDIITYRLKRTSSVTELEFLTGELIFILERAARQQGYQYETRVLFHDLKKDDFLMKYESREVLAGEMNRLTEAVFQYLLQEKKYDVLEEIRDYVQGHYMEELLVADLAGKYHLNASWLSSSFKERYKISLSSYIEGIRMEKAKKMLREDAGNITEIAILSGYSDANYFTKVFKKYTGMTPSRWKKRE